MFAGYSLVKFFKRMCRDMPLDAKATMVLAGSGCRIARDFIFLLRRSARILPPTQSHGSISHGMFFEARLTSFDTGAVTPLGAIQTLIEMGTGWILRSTVKWRCFSLIVDRTRANGTHLRWLMIFVITLTSSAAPGVERSQAGAVIVALAETAATDEPLRIPRLDASEVDIRLDGSLDESVWASLPAYDNMTVTQPDLGIPGRFRTETYLFYTERGLYVGAYCEQPPETFLSRLTSRDSFGTADAYQIMVDSSGNGLYGYWFMTKLGDSVADGILLPESNFQNNWDGPWRSATRKLENGWSVEVFLPWAMMNMPRSTNGVRRMNIHITRDLGVLNERWSWPALPMTRPKFLSAFQPVLLNQVEPRQEVSLFPYATFNRDMAREENSSKAGLDVFWRPSPEFFLSGALNPDFGQVDADDVVVNLTAFETFFPEKRLFFLENQDVFDTRGDVYGPPRTLLHTRRIGSSVGARRGDPDVRAGLSYDGFDTSKPVDLLVAVKAVTQIGKHRAGVFFAAEDDTDLGVNGSPADGQAPGRDFAVLRWQRDDTSTGNRRAIGWLGTITEHPDRRAITQDVDVHFDSTDGVWNVDAELMHSSIEGEGGFGFSGTAKYAPRTGDRHLLNVWGYDNEIDLNDLGFLNRNDVAGFFYEFFRRRQGFERIRDTTGWVDALGEFNGDGKAIGAFVIGHQGVTFNNNVNIFGNLGYRPSVWDDRNSRGAGTFELDDRWTITLGVNSPSDKRLAVGGNMQLWQEHFFGKQVSTRLFVNYSPVDRLRVDLGIQYEKRDNWLVWQEGSDFSGFASERWGPNVTLESFFTARQQLSLRLQWVAIQAFEVGRYRVEHDQPLVPLGRPAAGTGTSFAISDLVIQARYRWQIAPMSDLFVVYNRGGGLPGATTGSSFGDLFNDTLAAPEREGFAVKLRYRFGL